MLFPASTVQKEHRAIDVLVVNEEQAKVLKCLDIAEHLLDMLFHAGVEHVLAARIRAKDLKTKETEKKVRLLAGIGTNRSDAYVSIFF